MAPTVFIDSASVVITFVMLGGLFTTEAGAAFRPSACCPQQSPPPFPADRKNAAAARKTA